MRSLIRSLLLALAVMALGCPPYPLEFSQATVNEVTAANRYTGNGTATAFPYTFRILVNTDIEVLVDGVTKTLTTDYTVSGVDASGGGSVTFVTAPASGLNVTLLRKQPPQQTSTYVPGEAFPASRIEKDFDQQTMLNQQQAEQLLRAITLPVSSPFTNVRFPDNGAATNAHKFIKWNAAGTGLEAVPSASLIQAGTLTVTDLAVNRIAVADGTAGVKGFAGFSFDGTSLTVNAVGPHAIGGPTVSTTQWLQTGSFAGDRAFHLSSTIAPGLNTSGYGVRITPTLVEHSSGTHALMAGGYVAPVMTAGVAATTTFAGLAIDTFVAQSGTVNAAGLHLMAPPSGATNNYALWVAGGNIRSDGLLLLGTTVTSGASAGSLVLPNNAGGIWAANAAGTAALAILSMPSNNQIYFGNSTSDIRYLVPLVALGGGATPTFGTIGGSGPGTAAQNKWMRWVDQADGSVFWVPVWK